VAVSTLTPARALRQPRRLDVRALLGVALTVSALGGSIVFWSASSDTREVLVADRDLPVGARLATGDLAVARVRVSDGIYAAAVPASDRAAVMGRELSEPVHAQQILVRQHVSGRAPLGPGQVAVSIPVTTDSAVGGRIRPGDAVQVLLTTNKDRPDARTTVVLPRAVVYDVGYGNDRLTVISTGSGAGGAADPTSGGADARGAPTTVTLALASDDAVLVTQARWSGAVTLALLPTAGQP
jgi:pilus assembly protein CpaB